MYGERSRTMEKGAALNKIAQEIQKCKECIEGKSGSMVFGEGDPDADIVFVGEAPGKEEAKVGRPFVGRSGKLLRGLIAGIGLKEDDVYITSPVKYLPDRGTPSRKDIEHAKKYFDRQLAIIDPKLIVLLGSVAAQAVLGEKLPILKEHGKVIERSGKKYFLTLHPAAALRIATFRPILEEDFRKLKAIIGKGRTL